MTANRRMSRQTEILVFVTPNFNMAATMNFIDPFRVANYLEGFPLFHWRFLSEEGTPVLASNGASLSTEKSDGKDLIEGDIFIVSSSWTPEKHVSHTLKSLLRHAANRQVTLAGMDTGAFVLAYAGLLDGYRATVHYEHIDAFRELFPKTQVTEALWEFDRNRLTCCGGAAALDLSLQMINDTHGATLANAAARYLFSSGMRSHGANQFPQAIEPLGNTVPASVRQAIRIMEENLETPLPIPQICRIIGLSHRQLDRLFAKSVNKTPALYYRDIRLDRARGLVTQTNLSMSEIAYASGFSSQVHFSRAYRERFGLAPSKDRVEGRIPFEFRAWPMYRAPITPADEV